MASIDPTRELEQRDVPAPVGIAAIIGLGKSAFEALFGLLGIAVATSIDDAYGFGMLAFGIAYFVASLLLLRGNRAAYYVTIVLSAVGLVVGVIYLFRSSSLVSGGTFIASFFNALVLYLLLGRESARAYFARRPPAQ